MLLADHFIAVIRLLLSLYGKYGDLGWQVKCGGRFK